MIYMYTKGRGTKRTRCRTADDSRGEEEDERDGQTGGGFGELHGVQAGSDRRNTGAKERERSG